MEQIKVNREQVIQLLFEKKCINCYGDLRLEIEFNKESLEIIFRPICKKCNTFYLIKRQCKTEEELINLGMHIAESTIEDKGFVKAKI